MKLNDFKIAIGADRFLCTTESKAPYWITNISTPLQINKSYADQINKNPLLTIIADQEYYEVLAIFIPGKSWPVDRLDYYLPYLKERMDVIFNAGTDPSNS